MTDWNAVQAEYIRTDISCRKLAEKHGIPASTLMRRCRKEEWAKLREETGEKRRKAVAKSTISADLRIARKVQAISERLLDQMQVILEDQKDPTTLVQLALVLQRVAAVQGIKSELDVQEQQARIRNLEKQAERDTEDRSITIQLAPELDAWAQ